MSHRVDRNDYVQHIDFRKSHNLPGATDNISEFQCILCKKIYSRRDLRDRHQRRCAKTFGQKRVSRQRSCESCARKKLRCSLTRPACSRCMKVGASCHYPNISSTPEASWGHGAQAEAPDPEIMQPLIEGLAHVSTDSNSEGHFTSVPLGVHDMYSSHMTAGISPTPTLNDMGLMLHLPEYETVNFAASQDRWPDLGPSLSVGESDHHQSALFVSPEQTFDLPHTSEITSQPNFADIAQATLLLPSAENLSTVNRTTDGNDIGISAPDFSRNNLSLFGHSLFDDILNLEGNTIKMSQALLQILCEYPRFMLQPQFWSPFIHHNLYRCSQNGMAEPLGIALACVSAYVNSVESSFAFVENMINSQRERLVRDFRLSIDRPETCLAALHAVCIYQILGLFEQKYADEGSEKHQEDSRKAAELHSFFLLKMTRCLCGVHKTAIDGNETSWSEWKFNESLRRNVFFVNIVNILAAEARSLQYDYFEPLDDDMMLKMPLPAPEGVWRACSENEWRVAREYAHSITPTPRTLQDLIDSSEKDTLDVSSLQPLTRMILECHKIRPHLKDQDSM